MPSPGEQHAAPPHALRAFARFLDEESRATGLPLRALLALAVALHVWVTFQAINPWHADEHFQILEFAWARAGLATTDTLPWEWSARIRSSLQPTLALGALQVLRSVGLESPWLWNILLRLGSLSLAFAALLRIIGHVSPTLGRRGRVGLWVTSLFLWIAPLLLARFSSENLGGLTLALAIVWIEGGSGTTRTPHRRWDDLGAGALFGLSFLFRFQMALAIVPVLAWLVVGAAGTSRGDVLRRFLLVVTGAGAVALAGALLDRWFYGTWVFTPWNYVVVNLVEGVAATFGTSPWYAYVTETPVRLIPPLGIALALLVLTGALAHPRSPWTWAAVAFFVGHSLLAHKEFRFLIPLLYIAPVLVARGVERVPTGRWTHATAIVLAAQNGLLLALLLTPAIHQGREPDMHYFRWLWNQAESHPNEVILVLDEGGTAQQMWGLEVEVFHHPRVRSVPLGAADSARGTVATPVRVLQLVRGGGGPPPGARSDHLVYAAEPGYRAIARAFGVEDARWVSLWEELEGWTDSTHIRRVYDAGPP